MQVKGSRAEVLKLLHSLDDSGRLAILPEQHIRDGVRSGMFALMKSLQKDRLILDCRPANCLEEPIADYTQAWPISPQRDARNCLAFELAGKEARSFKCFSKAGSSSGRFIPALQTMAMGDVNACCACEAGPPEVRSWLGDRLT